MNFILKFLTAAVLKKLAISALRYYVLKSDNKIDDSVLAIYDKVEKEDYNIGKELDVLGLEAKRLWDEREAKEGK